MAVNVLHEYFVRPISISVRHFLRITVDGTVIVVNLRATVALAFCAQAIDVVYHERLTDRP